MNVAPALFTRHRRLVVVAAIAITAAPAWAMPAENGWPSDGARVWRGMVCAGGRDTGAPMLCSRSASVRVRLPSRVPLGVSFPP